MSLLPAVTAPGTPPTPLFSPSQSGFGEEVTARDIARLVYTRRWLVLGTFLVTLVLVTVAVFMLPKTYVSRAKLHVRAELQPVPGFFTGLAATTERRDYEPVARRIETEMEMLETMPLLASVVDTLHLTYDDVYHAPLEVLTRPFVTVWDAVRVQLGLLTEPPDRTGAGAALGGLVRGLEIAPVLPKSPESGSNLIQVTLTAPTPHGAQDQLRALLSTYLASHARAAETEATGALAIIDQQLATAAAELKTADGQMRSFLARAPRGGGDTPGFTSARDDESVSRLKAQQLDLQMQLVQARLVYTDSSEKVRSLQGAIRDLEAQVAREVASGAARTSTLTLLTREQQAREQRFTDLQRRRNEVALYRSVVATLPQGVTIVEPPGLPNSWNWKRRVLMLAGGGVLGLLMGLVLASLFSFLDPTVRTAVGVRQASGLPVVARVPVLPRAEILQATTALDERAGEQPLGQLQQIVQRLVPQLITRVRRVARPVKGGRVIVVTSAESGAGKTMVATSLAMQLAQLDYGRVLLVDTDLATPSLHRALQIANTAGYSDALASGATEPGVSMQTAPGVALDILTAGRTGTRESLAMNLDRVRTFVSAARERYDWIIFDAGTIVGGSVITLQQEMDALVVVVNSAGTRSMALRDAMTHLQLGPDVVTAAVLNRVERDLPDFLYQRL